MTKKTQTSIAVGRRKALAKRAMRNRGAPRPDPNTLPALREPDGDAAEVFAQVALHPTPQAANTIQSYRKAMDGSGLDFETLVGELTKQVVAVRGGDLGRTEEMLIAQAHSLDAIFGNLARRAAIQEHLPHMDGFLRLALKAQGQCRTTLETLATIKNPPNVAFVRQANIAHGPQQVNNGISTDEGSRAREIETEQSKLSGVGNELLPDTRASALTGRIDPRLAAVGTVNRTANARRKGKGKQE